MTLSTEKLNSQLLEYRKSLRGMMWYYDAAEALAELIQGEMEKIDAIEKTKWGKLTDELDNNCKRPKGISSEAFQCVKENTNNWVFMCSSDKEFKARRNSIYVMIYLDLDLWPDKEPEESLSALVVYLWWVKDHKGRVNDLHEDLDDDFKTEVFDNDGRVDSEGNPLQPMKLASFPDVWSAEDKYFGDYAVGLYDLSEMTDEDAVRDGFISDIKELILQWNS